MMSFDEFISYVERYDDLEDLCSTLYGISMLGDDCKINDAVCLIADLICRDFGADCGWFLCWAPEHCVRIKDWTPDQTYGGVDYTIDGLKQMYEFLCNDPIAKEECWL